MDYRAAPGPNFSHLTSLITHLTSSPPSAFLILPSLFILLPSFDSSLGRWTAGPLSSTPLLFP